MNITNLSHSITQVYKNIFFWHTLVDQSKVQAGPFDGGCLICAQAIIKAVGRGVLVRITSPLNDGQTEHYGALIDGMIFDFDGPAKSSNKWIERFRKNEMIYDRKLFFAKGLDLTTETPWELSTSLAIAELIIKFSPTPEKELISV